MRKFEVAAILCKGAHTIIAKVNDSTYSMFILNSEIKCSKLKNWSWSKELDCLIDTKRNLLFYIEELPTFYV